MTYLQAVSISIPEKPKALSPCIQNTGDLLPDGIRDAAIANPQPTPMVPNVPASSLNIIIIINIGYYTLQGQYLIH